MNIDHKAREANAYVQAALDGVLFAIQGVHQAAAEKPVDVASRFGLSEQKATLIKDSHRRIVGSVYGGIRKVQHGLGDVAVEQVSELAALAKALMTSSKARTSDASASPRSAEPVQRKRSTAKKVTKKTTKKTTKRAAKTASKKTSKKKAASRKVRAVTRK